MIFQKDDIFQQSKGCNNFVFESNLISQFEENVISFDFVANALVKKHTFDSGLKHLLLKCDVQVKVNPTRLNMGSNNINASSSLPCDVTRITELTANFKFTSIYCNTCWKKSSLAFITVEQALQLKSLQFKLSQTFLESKTLFMYPFLQL